MGLPCEARNVPRGNLALLRQGFAGHASLSTSLRAKHGWRQPGLNRRPRACKARALPTELCPRLKPAADAVVTPVAAIQQQSAHPTFFEPEEV